MNNQTLSTEKIKNRKSIAFGAMATNLFSKVTSTLVPFLTSILVMRLLSVKEFGTFSLFLSFLSFFGGLSLGIHHVYQRYVASYVEDKTDFHRLIKLTVVMTILRVGIFLALLSIIYFLKVLNLIDPAKFNYPYIYLSVIICVAVICKLTLQEGLISAYIDQKFYNLFDSSITIAKALLIVLLMPTSVIVFIYIWLILEIFRVIVLLVRFSYLIWRDKAKSNVQNKREMEYKRYFDYGKYFFFASVSSQILAFDIDQYFLSYFRGNEEVGIYSFSTKMSFFLIGFAPANLLFNVVTPMLIKDYEKNKDADKFRDIINTLFKLNTFVYAAIALLFCFNVDYIIKTIFQGKYSEAEKYIFILVALSFLPVIKNTFEPLARGIEKSRVYLSGFISAGVNIIGNLLLIPTLGIAGAVISTGFAIFLQSMAFVLFARKEINFSFDKNYMIKMAVNIGLIVVLGYLLHHYFYNSLLKIIIANILLISLFLFIFKVNRCFNDNESEFINSFLPKRLFIF